jgi:hypothetical protein
MILKTTGKRKMAFTNKELAFLTFISKHEWATPDTAYGQSKGGSSKYQTSEKKFGKPLSRLTITQVLALCADIHAETKAAGVAGGIGTSAVGSAQFVAGTLKAMLTRCGVTPNLYGTTVFSPLLQQEMTVSLLKSIGLDPNHVADWMHIHSKLVTLGNTWESLDMSKGKISHSQLTAELAVVANTK